MVLTTHAVTGAALASLTPNQPLLGFAVGFASHFVLDAIPHWDYYLASQKKDENNRLNDEIPLTLNRNFLKDIFKIGLDGFTGLLFAYFFFVFYLNFSAFIVFCGIAGAILPDILQFVQIKYRHEPFNSLRQFHIWIQSWKSLNDKPVWGVLSQIALICLVVWGVVYI
jgi:hypothetical protein